MALMRDIVYRVRLELGDMGEKFRTSFEGDGSTLWFDLPVQMVSPTGFHVYVIDGTVITDIPSTAYKLDQRNGSIELSTAVGVNKIFVVEGLAYGLFTDEELGIFISDAIDQHTSGRYATSRFRDTNGFIKYREVPMDLDSLPPIEDYLIALLATIESLWVLSTDASTDIDVTTAEGTHLPRSQRWAQIRQQIDFLENKYKEFCAQLNIGLFRIEMFTLRRVSRTSGRLVPLFKEREYDDSTLPVRLLPPIDRSSPDESGVASPIAGMPGAP